MKIHFIGIGGIGMSALARYFLAEGNEVSGSDCAENPILEELRKLGIKIFFGHQKGVLDSRLRGNDKGIDLVIYSAAVPDDNPELVEARRLGIKCQKYAETLGDLTKKMFTIAVSGMHGKSTTTAMVGLMMEKAGLDPTVILGTKVREWNNSNFRLGKSQYLVIEADEYDRSFLNYWPKILVLLNIEEEHLDTYTGGLEDILNTFGEYIGHLPEDGALIFNGENKNINKILENSDCGKRFYSSSVSPHKRTEVEKLEYKVLDYTSLRSNNKYDLKLKIPGQHNVSNANAALAVARVLSVDEKIAIESLNEFSGTWRRMEYKGEINGAKIYDDYGHHPTEIKATLEGARELMKEIPPARLASESVAGRPNPPLKRGNRGDVVLRKGKGKLWCVFQPHQYQRTHKLFDQFLGAFDAADEVIILPIYSVVGREKDEIKKKVSSEMLTEALIAGCQSQKNIIYLDNFDKTVVYLRQNLKLGDVCIIMGAGDIYLLTEKLI